MIRLQSHATKLLFAGAVIFFALIFLRHANAQTPRKTGNSVEQELVHTEFGFFEAWKSKDLTYFRSHIADNGVSWGENGTLSREEAVEEQVISGKNCTVQGYGLSDFNAEQISAGTYLLTYTAERYATCSGEKLPVHINGSSIYIFKDGRWQAVYRAQVPLRNQS
jgi:hypothetical protein